jgi:hypothetical protein
MIEQEYANLRKKLRYVEFGGGVQADEYAEFNAICLSLVDRVAGRHDAYYLQVLRELDRHPMTSETLASTLYGIVQSLKRDIEADALTNFREREHADLYELLLQQAEQLLGQEQKDAAAILISGVVVVHLQQLADKHEIVTAAADEQSDPQTPEWLNSALAQSVYGRLEQQNVTTWLNLWRRSAHAAYGAYSHDHVRLTLHSVRAFLTQFPA